MKSWKRRWLAGTLAFLLSCSALVSFRNMVFAAPGDKAAGEGEKAVLKDVAGEDGQGFFADRPDTCFSTYLIRPEKGDSYEVTRKIVVKPREDGSKGADGGQKSTKEDTEESDPEPELVLTEASDVPESTDHLKLDVSLKNVAYYRKSFIMDMYHIQYPEQNLPWKQPVFSADEVYALEEDVICDWLKGSFPY